MDIPRTQNKFRRRLVRGASVGAVFVLVGLITAGVSRLKPADPAVERASVVIDTVKRGSLLRQVRGYGKLVPEDIQWIPAVTQGRVQRILVRPGATVGPDTVLLEMTNPELERDASAAQMEVRAAEADHISLRIKLEKEILDLRSALATVQANYSQAQLSARLDEELAQEGLISDRQRQISKMTAQELTTRLEIEQKRIEISNEAVQAQLDAQSARVDQARAMARLKLEQVGSLHVRAGTTGVLALLPVEVGQQVMPGTNLARVANPSRLKAEIKIPETQAKDIVIGQPATIDTHNGVIEGRVVRIDPSVQEGSVTVDIVPEGELPLGVRPDLSVDGTIQLEHLDDVLYVGRPAFGQEKSMVGLFKLETDGTRAVRIQVKFGRSSVSSIEVLEGLKPGDQVIVSDMSSWDAFEAVRLD